MSTSNPGPPPFRPALTTLALLVGSRVTRGLSTGILVGVLAAIVTIGVVRPASLTPFVLPLLVMQVGQLVWARKIRQRVRSEFSDLTEAEIEPMLPRVHELDLRGEGLAALRHLRS